ncbi:kynurenine 3-monooxygenase-like protein [Amylocarpus encephaloides]|uniref:Kynurenine 3-monooxygenase n=1 Tax=Amylocarpus encephaloides TaxID=45428 RepID=A0A9P7Y9Q7_9HELO|nr:kynurenine 3-monooxygenase-like protein [Amylocarpus encephaloides]
MAQIINRQKTVIIGAGPVGTLAALYAAQRGDDVEVYELRSDLRDPSTIPLNFTKSINLALSERGINAMRQSGRPAILDKIFSETIPMKGRMIHGKTASGELYEQSQEYDVHGKAIYAVDRGGLNKALLDELEAMPNVKVIFNHKLTGADFKARKAWFEIIGSTALQNTGRNREIEIDFDFMIGADGAHSAARYHLMKYSRMDYQQEYIDTLWCEFQIEAKPVPARKDKESRFWISPNHLHIWPGKDFMFIAIPSFDGSFTCTLFMPSSNFSKLEAQPSKVPEFFDTHFPGVTNLIIPPDLISSFNQNPHLPLINIKCQPHHFSDSIVIVGDAAHAMVPFYGQGMNAGLEDIRILFEFLDKHSSRQEALDEYSDYRKADAHVINDLALQNYVEMRSSVVSPIYAARKWLEETLSVYVPRLGWQTKYSRVSFGNERYSEVIKKSERQGKLIAAGLIGLVSSPVVLGLGLAVYNYRKAHDTTKGTLALPGWFGRKTT